MKKFKALALIDESSGRVEFVDVYKHDNNAYEADLMNFAVSLATHKKFEPEFRILEFEWDESTLPLFEFYSLPSPQWIGVRRLDDPMQPAFQDTVVRYRLPPILTDEIQDCGCNQVVDVKKDGTVEVYYAKPPQKVDV